MRQASAFMCMVNTVGSHPLKFLDLENKKMLALRRLAYRFIEKILVVLEPSFIDKNAKTGNNNGNDDYEKEPISVISQCGIRICDWHATPPYTTVTMLIVAYNLIICQIQKFEWVDPVETAAARPRVVPTRRRDGSYVISFLDRKG